MNTNKRVLFVCHPYWVGGPVTWLRRVGQYLPQQGWECKLVLPGTIRALHGDWKDWPGPLETLRPAYSGPELVRSLANAIRSFAPAVVVGVALDAVPNAVRLLRRSNQGSFRYLDTLHNDNEAECERLRPHADVIDAVGVCSEGCGQRVRTQTPELADRVVRFWYPSPCDDQLHSQRYRLGPLRLVFLARMYQYQKRVLDLVPLCNAALKAKIDFRLTVLGDGPERAIVEAGIRALPGIGDRVEFLGWLANREALEVLHRQHVFLMLSEFEGQPIAMLEAMGSGVVPVVTDIPALREVIDHGNNGFLLPVGGSQQFATVLAHLAINRERLAHVAEAAWRRVRGRWEIGLAVSKLSGLLDDVVAGNCQPAVTLAPISYPASRMTELGVPHAVQGIKRRLLRQDVVF